MIDGILLGVLTWLSMLVSFVHFPKWLKKFLLSHFMLTDIICIILTFLALSSISQSIMAVVGSVTCGLLVNLTLMGTKKPVSNELQKANQ